MKIVEVVSHQIFYKGYNPGDTRRIRTGNDYWDSKMFVASDPHRAEFYGTHVRVFDAPDAKILYEGSRAFISLAKGLRTMLRRPDGRFYMLDYYVEVVKRAEAAGYDAVWFSNQGDVGTVVINPDKFIERPA
jgi:hypothetical protein